jgi:hypothetical protein
MMLEVWKDIPGYEGLYQASVFGDIRNAQSGAILKPFKCDGRYLRVKLYRLDGKRVHKTHMVHRLVAMAFIPNTYNKPQVNHIDGNKENNNATNLEWCTQSENLSHSVKIGLRDMSCCTNATKKTVYQYSLDGTLVRAWESMSQAARELGLQTPNISHCCAGRIRQTGGYKWSLEH